MRPCVEYLELMDAVLDGEATPLEQARLEAHLACCPACAALFEDLKALHEGAEGLTVPAPEGLYERIMETVRAESKPKLTVLPKKKKNRWFPLAAAAAVCALVIFSSGNLDHILSAGGGAEAPGAAMEAAPAPSAAPDSLVEMARDEMGSDGSGMGDTDFKEKVEYSTSGAAFDEDQAVNESNVEALTQPAPEAPAEYTLRLLTQKEAHSLVLDRILGDLYDQPGADLKMVSDENSTAISLVLDTGFAEESTLTYTGLSPNGKYHTFAWTWEGQTEEDLRIFRYAVPLEESYVIWAGETFDPANFDAALSE